MRDVSFCTSSFATPQAVAYGERTLACLLWGLCFANTGYLLDHPATPLLYQSGVHWQEEVPTGKSGCGGPGQEKFLGVEQVLGQGHADCEDVACWRISELRLGRGLMRGPLTPPMAGHPRPTVIPVPWGMRPLGPNVQPAFFKREVAPRKWLYHIIVFWPELGQFEDPSRVLGMGRRYG